MNQRLVILLSAVIFCAVSLGGGYAIWSGVADNYFSKGALAVFVEAPDLDRPINISVEMTPDQQLQMATKITEITSLLKTNLELADYWIELGGLYQVVGDHEGARQAWEYAVYLRPQNHIPYNNLGFLYRYYLNDIVKAEENFLLAAAHKTDLVAAYRELSDLYRYNYTEKSDEADDILLEGLEKNPESFDLLVYLAIYYRDVGEIAKAQEYFRKALAVDPGNEAVARELNSL